MSYFIINFFMELCLSKLPEYSSIDLKLKNEKLGNTFEQIKNYINNILLKGKKHPIIDFINKHQDILKDFLIFNKDIIYEIQKNLDNPNKLNFIYSEILTEILKKVEININYEKIVDKNGTIIFHEGLLRVNSQYSFNHIDLLDLAKITGKTINIFNEVFFKITNDLKDNVINGPISINAEVSDIIDPNFIDEIEKIIKYNNINLSKQKIIIEILENQKIPNTKEFFEKIVSLKKMGFTIAFDDIFSEKVGLVETINNLQILNYNIDIIKIDGKKIHELYNIYKLYPESNLIKKCKDSIKITQQKGVKVVAEWIESEEILFFAKEILGVDLFQGFLFKNK